MTKYTNTGLLTAREFASSCVSKGVSIKPEHILWTVEQKLIEPIIHTKGVDYFSEYQIYLIDLIQDRREQSLNYPTAAGISRSGNKGRWISPEIGWQEYLFLNKESILNETRKWNLVAPIFPEIQKLHNEYLHKALIKKETFESDLGSKIPFNDTWEPTIAGGAADAFKLLKKHPDISEDILRYWMSKLLARAIRHNPALPLSAQLPNLWTLFEKEETKLSSVFTMGNPIRLPPHAVFAALSSLVFKWRYGAATR